MVKVASSSPNPFTDTTRSFSYPRRFLPHSGAGWCGKLGLNAKSSRGKQHEGRLAADRRLPARGWPECYSDVTGLPPERTIARPEAARTLPASSTSSSRALHATRPLRHGPRGHAVARRRVGKLVQGAAPLSILGRRQCRTRPDRKENALPHPRHPPSSAW